ncbi:MAG: HAD-IB family phosphatase [Magnetococcus sp. DMHC-6]
MENLIIINRDSVIFDFDRTMVFQETMSFFLRSIAGQQKFLTACCGAGARAALVSPSRRREIFRVEILRRILAGKTLDQARGAAESLFKQLEWIPSTMQEFQRHQEAGRRILVATGSLSAYMPTIFELKSLHLDALFSTEMEIEGNLLTGEMKTLSCTWSEKARRVQEWLVGTKGEVWGYGNLPHDGAMLALTDHPTVVPL